MNKKSPFQIKTSSLEPRATVRRKGGPVSLLLHIPYVNLLAPLWVFLNCYRYLQGQTLLHNKSLSWVQKSFYALAIVAQMLFYSILVNIILLYFFFSNPFGSMVKEMLEIVFFRVNQYALFTIVPNWLNWLLEIFVPEALQVLSRHNFAWQVVYYNGLFLLVLHLVSAFVALLAAFSIRLPQAEPPSAC